MMREYTYYISDHSFVLIPRLTRTVLDADGDILEKETIGVESIQTYVPEESNFQKHLICYVACPTLVVF